MLIETGRIVALDEEGAWVETLRQSSCGKCAARPGCGHGMLNSALPGASRGLLRVLRPAEKELPLKLHDTVEIALPENNFLHAVWLLYAVPLLSTLLAALLANRFWVRDAASQGTADLQIAVAACIGLLLGLLAVRWRGARRARDPGFQPRITSVI